MPRTSAIIPAYNAEENILHSLEAFERQTIKDFEVIVVDDGSTDTTAELVTQFRQQSKFPVRLIHQKNSGPAKARNVGVERAEGEIILFLDSDCIPAENWLGEMTRPLGHDVAGCYCWNRVRNPESMASRYVDYEMTRRHEGMIGKDIDSISTYSASFLKKVFTECGGFDIAYPEASGEDFDLTYDIAKAGYKMKFVDSTYVYQYHPDSWRKYFYRQFRRGYWSVRLYLKHKDKIIKGNSYTGHGIEAQFVLCLLALLSIPLAIFYPFAVLVGFGILVLSNLPFGLWTFRKEKKFLFIAPVIASIRSLAGTLGAFKYVIENGLK